MLPFYAERFSTTEINYTFHRIPSPKTIEGWTGNTPEGFKFSLKGPQRVTHYSKLRNCADTMQYFVRCILGLGEKLGPILFQLPPSFARDTALLEEFLALLPPELSAAFEFRHPSWFEDEIFALLERQRAALCLADTEDRTVPSVATTQFGYLRLRREDYREPDLRHWADFVQSQKERWRSVFIYFKHEESGIGPKLAQQMIAILAQSG